MTNPFGVRCGRKMWAYSRGQEGIETSVADQNNIVYVGDSSSVLHGVSGGMVWMDGSISSGGVGEIVKLGIHYGSELVVSADNAAYWLY